MFILKKEKEKKSQAPNEWPKKPMSHSGIFCAVENDDCVLMIHQKKKKKKQVIGRTCVFVHCEVAKVKRGLTWSTEHDNIDISSVRLLANTTRHGRFSPQPNTRVTSATVVGKQQNTQNNQSSISINTFNNNHEHESYATLSLDLVSQPPGPERQSKK